MKKLSIVFVALLFYACQADPSFTEKKPFVVIKIDTSIKGDCYYFSDTHTRDAGTSPAYIRYRCGVYNIGDTIKLHK